MQSKRFFSGFWVLLVLVMVFLSSCTVNSNSGIVTVRIPYEDLLSGGFYGGSLMYHPENSSLSHLAKGSLIAFQDILYGWKDEGDDSFTPEILSKKYGYIYVQAIQTDEIVYDYLLYDDLGNIIERQEQVVQPNMDGEAQFDSDRGTEGFSGISYHMPVEYSNPSITGSSILSFIHEIPEENEQGEIEAQETFRRVIFRLQANQGAAGAKTLPREFSNGIIGLSIDSPKSLVINASYLPENETYPTESEDVYCFYKTDLLPPFHVGDYVIHNRVGKVLLVTGIDDSYPDYVVLTTQESFLEDALGTVVLQLQGDLGEMIQRYGNASDRAKLEVARTEVLSVLQQRNTYQLLNLEKDFQIVNQDKIKVTLQNKLSISVSVSLNFDLSWKSVSSQGSVLFPIDLSSKLLLDAFIGIEKSDSQSLGGPSISFTISGIPIQISVPVDYFYNLKMVLAELQGDFGPVLNVSLGFSYNVGASIKFKWKVIPIGINTWANASGTYSHSFSLDGPNFQYSGKPTLALNFGMQISPGITIAAVVRPQVVIPFTLQNIFTLQGLSPQRTENRSIGNVLAAVPSGVTRTLNAIDIGRVVDNSIHGHVEVDLNTSGRGEIDLGVKFIHKTFDLGTFFTYNNTLYSKDF